MIEANTYINTLLHFTTIVQEANTELDPSKKVQVNIIANQKGSFIVDLAILAQDTVTSIGHLFGKDNMEYAANLAAVVGATYGVAKFLRGDKPKAIQDPIRAESGSGQVVSITNSSGQTNTFDFRGAHIYINNPIVQNAVNQEMETLNSDESVTGFEIQDGQGTPLVVFDREDIEGIAGSSQPITSSKEDRVIPRTAKLYIISLDWDLKRKWEFINRGYKISAKIKDEAFAEDINKGERFGKGDLLGVEMDIYQVFDKSVDTWVNKSYTVTRILKHMIKPEQNSLDFEQADEQ